MFAPAPSIGKSYGSNRRVQAHDVNLVDGSAFALGPIHFAFSRQMSDEIEFDTVGDLGLLRELTVIDAKGALVSHSQRDTPFMFWDQTYVYYWDWKTADSLQGLTVRAKLFSKARYYDVPFNVSVPIDRRGSTTTNAVPTTSK